MSRDLLRLWSIQTVEAWEIAKERGALRADPAFVWPDFIPAYEWLAGQMAERIGPPPDGCRFPVWAWRQADSARRPRPDLRESGHLERGARGVRLELLVPAAHVLLSDFLLWHYPLNYWHLGASESDSERFEAELADQGLSPYETKPLAHPGYHAQIQRSWERIFDLDWDDLYFTFPRDQKPIQATLWEVRPEDVRSVTLFTAR
ncbi:MAG TPA: DUF3841 domain-containing protein [Herpetosiphonaceae bacterium]